MSLKHILRPFFLLGVIACATCANHYAYAANDIDKLASQFMRKNNVNGVVVGVVYKGQPIFYNYGYTSKQKQQKVTNQTIFEIASITKTFTATLAGVAHKSA